MYIEIASAAYDGDQEVFKKHFAKAIGNDMLGEKVKVVQISMAKLIHRIPLSYSRSVDKVREHLLAKADTDVKQFLLAENPLQFINPDNLKLQLKAC